MAKLFGLKVASEKDEATKAREPRIDTTHKQFKYRKVINLVIAVPALPVGTSWSKDVVFNFSDIGLKFSASPAYDYRLKGHNGRWAKPKYGYSQAYLGSEFVFPYYKLNETISREKFAIQLRIFNANPNPATINSYDYPAHNIIIRLYLMYDEMAA